LRPGPQRARMRAGRENAIAMLGGDRRYDAPKLPQLPAGIAHAHVRRRLHLDLGLQEFLRDSPFRRAFCSLEESERNITGKELAPGIDDEIFLLESKREGGLHRFALPFVFAQANADLLTPEQRNGASATRTKSTRKAARQRPAGLSGSNEISEQFHIVV